MTRKRWFIYLLVGIAFGICDYYYQILVTAAFPPGSINQVAWMTVILSVWLVVLIPIAWHETRRSQSAWLAALAGIFTWSTAVVAYYSFIVGKLIFLGEASRREMHISNRNDPFYWINVKNYLGGDFLAGVSEWFGIAVVGGFLVGFVVGLIVRRLRTLRFMKQPRVRN